MQKVKMLLFITKNKISIEAIKSTEDCVSNDQMHSLLKLLYWNQWSQDFGLLPRIIILDSVFFVVLNERILLKNY